MKPFQAVVDAGVEGIMVSYGSVNGTKMHRPNFMQPHLKAKSHLQAVYRSTCTLCGWYVRLFQSTFAKNAVPAKVLVSE
eukprot:5663418-Amphidinium_carterae.1